MAAARSAPRLIPLQLYAPIYSACSAFICLNASQVEILSRRIPFRGEKRFAFMNLLSFQRSSARWLAAAVATGIGVVHVSSAAVSPPATTNAPSVTLDALVADVLEHNPELNFYRAEIAAAKGERRTAATWANPEASTTVGQKQVRSGGLSDEGSAWSVSVQQTFEWPGRIPGRITDQRRRELPSAFAGTGGGI